MKLFFIAAFLVISGNSYANNDEDPCKNPRNRMEFAACDKYKYKKEDARLNDVYSKLMSFSKSYFNIGSSKTGQQTGDNVANKLREAQRTWIKYRDANCNYQYHTYYPGSHASKAAQKCKLMMTKTRADELQKQYDFWSTR